MFCSRVDANIVNRELEGVKYLYDCDGDLLATFPSHWTEEDIFKTLDFANMAYDSGYKSGQINRSYEIKRLLEDK